jgi:hypothetical protein
MEQDTAGVSEDGSGGFRLLLTVLRPVCVSAALFRVYSRVDDEPKASEPTPAVFAWNPTGSPHGRVMQDARWAIFSSAADERKFWGDDAVAAGGQDGAVLPLLMCQ